MISNPKITNITWSLFQNEELNFVISANVSLSIDITKIIALYNFTIPRDNDDHEFKRLLVKRNADVCRMAKGNKGDKIGKTILDEVVRSADFDLKCPIGKVKKLSIIYV